MHKFKKTIVNFLFFWANLELGVYMNQTQVSWLILSSARNPFRDSSSLARLYFEFA